jgi:hypothetical protein
MRLELMSASVEAMFVLVQKNISKVGIGIINNLIDNLMVSIKVVATS